MSTIHGKKYRIDVHALGYDDYSMVVCAPTTRVASQRKLEAMAAWCKHNDVDEDSIELPFTRIVPVDPATPVSGGLMRA